jgi:hypothetical protein
MQVSNIANKSRRKLPSLRNNGVCIIVAAMKNANIFIDVDLTLVDHNRQLISGAKEALQRLVDKGCHLFLWSTAGSDYARKIARLYEMTDLFEGFVAKPDIIVDDMPGTVLDPIHYDVNKEGSWKAVADTILEKHLD